MFEKLISGNGITRAQKETGGENRDQGLDGRDRLKKKKTVLPHGLFVASGALERKRVVGTQREVLRIKRQPQLEIVRRKIMKPFLAQSDPFHGGKSCARIFIENTLFRVFDEIVFQFTQEQIQGHAVRIEYCLFAAFADRKRHSREIELFADVFRKRKKLDIRHMLSFEKIFKLPAAVSFFKLIYRQTIKNY